MTPAKPPYKNSVRDLGFATWWELKHSRFSYEKWLWSTQISPTVAASYFGVTASTIHTWRKAYYLWLEEQA